MLNEENLVRFDYEIKYMLRDKANFDILEGFLSALLKQEISVIEILESEPEREKEKLKFNRVDILIKDLIGQKLIVRLQNLKEFDYLERLVWKKSKEMAKNFGVEKKCGKVDKVISISVMYLEGIRNY